LELYLAFEIVVWLTTGAMIILWLSELITDYGLGNGASLLIYTNIISSLPNLSKKILSENLTISSEIGNYFINFCFIIWNCFFTRREFELFH
jgi:preprotein translocase subunit SecY